MQLTADKSMCLCDPSFSGVACEKTAECLVNGSLACPIVVNDTVVTHDSLTTVTEPHNQLKTVLNEEIIDDLTVVDSFPLDYGSSIFPTVEIDSIPSTSVTERSPPTPTAVSTSVTVPTHISSRRPLIAKLSPSAPLTILILPIILLLVIC